MKINTLIKDLSFSRFPGIFILSFFLLLINCQTCLPQIHYDTIENYAEFAHRKTFSDKSKNNSEAFNDPDSHWVIENKYIKNEHVFNLGNFVSQMHMALYPYKNPSKDNLFFESRKMIFQNDKVPKFRHGQYTSTILPLVSPKFVFKRPVTLKDCTAGYFEIEQSTMESELDASHCRFDNIDMDMATGRFYLSYDTIESLIVKKCSNIYISEHNIFFDTSKPSTAIYSYSTINNYENQFNVFKKHVVTFDHDSMIGHIKFGYDEKIGTQEERSVEKNDTLNILFTGCYINCPISVDRASNYQQVVFDRCTFGKNAKIVNIRADELHFIDCDTLPALTTFILRPNASEIRLELKNSSLEYSRINFNKSVKVYFGDDESRDDITNVYESLLNKFKLEGKFDSYKRLDIEYKNVLASKGTTFDKIINQLNDLWWNYGYSKSRVILWTVGFWALFFILNVAFWKEVQEVYPLRNKVEIKRRPAFVGRVRYLSSILLYTSVLFFSLKIDLDRLNFTRTRMVAFFFIQYLVGLICLLFITSSILKT